MTFKYIVLGVIALIAILLYFDPMGRFDPEQTAIRSDTTIVNLPDIQVNIPPGKPSIVTVNIPQTVDTSKIIQDYFTTLKYTDSIETDSVKVHLTEWVRENRIVDRKLTTQFKFTTSNITTYVEEKRNKLYLGGTVNYSDRVGMSLVGVVVNRRDQMIMGSYDPFNKSIQGGVLVKIGTRK
jgi:hypothetical protein